MFYSCVIGTWNHILMAPATCTDSSLGAHKHTTDVSNGIQIGTYRERESGGTQDGLR